MIVNAGDPLLEGMMSELEASGCVYLTTLTKRLSDILDKERAAPLEDPLAHMLLYEGLVSAAFADYAVQLERASRECE